MRSECERLEKEGGRKFNPVQRFIVTRNIARRLNTSPTEEEKRVMIKITEDLMEIGMKKNEK